MSHIQIRISEEQKKEVKKVLDTMDLTYSAAIKLFFEELVEAGSWPNKAEEPKMSWNVSSVEEAEEVIQDDPREIPKTDDSTYVAQIDNTAFAWNPFNSRKIG